MYAPTRIFTSGLTAVKPEVNIRVGAYILKYLIATAGSLRNGLKFYVGAANAEDDGGYADKVLAERNRLIGQSIDCALPTPYQHNHHHLLR